MLIKIGKTFEIVGLCGSFCRSYHGNVPAEKMKKALERLRVAFFAKVYMKRKFQEMPVSLIVPFWRAAQFRGQWTGRLVPFCLSSLVRYSRDGLCRCCRLLFLSWSFIQLELCK